MAVEDDAKPRVEGLKPEVPGISVYIYHFNSHYLSTVEAADIL